jgi:UDP-N-acetylmuramoylalanine--D-glutamate ligase
LTAHLLNEAGISAMACGNISPSVLDALMAALDTKTLPKVWVVEVSSFQLETTHTLNAAAATVLNLSEDHLDRHGNMQGYAESKRRVFQGAPVRVLNRDDDYSLSMGGCGAKMVTFGLHAPSRSMDYGIKDGAICRGQSCLLPLSDSPLTGLHNATNLMAALALCEAIGVSAESVVPGLESFHGLAHRVETVGEHQGILFVDDSKGTNVGATLAAIEGLGRKLAIVLGGDGKGQDFSPLKTALQKHGRAVALIGKDASLIESAIAGCDVPTATFADMDSAVSWLSQQAKAGDAVLLSPACASLDMYRNYAHRADVFRAAVKTFVSGGAA